MHNPLKKFNWKAVAIVGAIIGAINYSPTEQKYPIAYSLGYGAASAGFLVLGASVVTKGAKDYQV